jgi:plasmid maintenance system antidote protein VapI
MLADELKQAILNTGKPIYQIAKESGVVQPILSRFMSGKRGLSLETAGKLSRYLNLELKVKLAV